MSVIFKKVWRDIWNRKVRTLLVVFSIAMGVIGVSVVLGTGEQLGQGLQDDYTATQPADIVVLTSFYGQELLAEIGRIPAVNRVEGALVFNARWLVDGEWQPMIVEATAPLDTRAIDQVSLVDGGVPAEGEFLLERTIRDVYAVSADQGFTLQTPTGDHEFAVSGFGRSAVYPPASFSKTAVAFVNLADAETLAGHANLNTVRLQLDDIEAAKSAEAELRQLLSAEDVTALSFTIRDPNSFPGKSSVDSLFMLMGVFGVLSLILSCFLVINTISTVLATEVKQIGTMKALGGTGFAVMRIYLTLVLIYGLIASVIGVIASVLATTFLTRYIARLANVDITDFLFSPTAIAAGLFVGIITPFVAALWPIWRGTQVTVREAITDYGISGGDGWLDRVLARIRWLPFTTAMGLRNTFRNKKRALLTLITLSMAGAAFLAVQATSSSLTSTLDTVIDIYNSDVVVDIDIPVTSESVELLFAGDGDVAIIEPWLDAHAKIDGVDVEFNGIPTDTALYKQSKVSEGRWFEAGDDGVIIVQEKFAADNAIAVGDVVNVEIGGSSADWSVIGIVRDYNAGGLTPLMPYDQLANTLDLAGHTNFVMIQGTERSADAVKTLGTHVEDTLGALDTQTRVNTVNEIREQAEATFQIIVLFLLMMVVIVAFVGGLGLLGTLTINVTERQKEIGVMRSIGATSRAIAQIFWLEGIVLGLFGWIIATLIGYPIAQVFTQLLSDALLPVEFYLPPSSVIIMGVGMLLLASISSVIPALSAARMRVSDILHYS